MWEHANGMDDTRIEANDAPQKSVSCSSTLESDALTPAALCRALLQQTEKAAYRMRARRMLTGLVKVHLRFHDLSYGTRQAALPLATSVTGEIYEAARELYDQANSSARPVRLVGVRAEQLVGDGGSALGLWDDDEDWREAEQTMDAIAARFGAGAVRPAALLTPTVQRRFGHGDG